MDFWSRIFGRPSQKDSADVAKQRLQLVLAQDRTNISPETLNLLKDEMIAVISRRVEIDQVNVHVSMTHTPQGERLVANIPVIRARAPARATAERAKRTRTPRPARA
ncbi:MAG: cell division topological specificity factor MinE [Chloroflexi bacterium]|nr:cell division topological specificity factor MinE [Chloroflexota bacterium]